MYSAIVLAAGVGSRMGLGFNKMLYSIHDKPVVIHTIQKFLKDERCSQVILVVNEAEVEVITDLVTPNDRLHIVLGGDQRQDSVWQGLQVVKEEVVLVHDGARPFVNQRMIDECYELGIAGLASVVGVAAKDTVKRVNNRFVIETLDRNEIYNVQTPQAAPTKLLRFAHEQAIKEQFWGTDEASLVEKYTDASVRVVEGSYENIKLTTPEDLLLAELLLRKEDN